MRKLLILSVLTFLVGSSVGCVHRNSNLCGGGSPGLFGGQQQQPHYYPQAQCCDPCAPAAAAPVMAAPCCQ